MIGAPRALRMLANIVSAKYGVPVTYEDPPFASAGDTEPIVSTLVVPKNVREIVSLPAAAAVGLVLNVAASNHNAIGHGGRFAVVENSGVWGLVPTHCENAEGRLVKHDSLLDSRVSFVPQKDDTCGTVLKKLSDDLSRRSPDLEVLSEGLPRRINPRVPYVRSNHNEGGATGRDVLNNIVRIMNTDLASTGWLLTWSMWYSPEPASRKPMSAVAFELVEVHDTPAFLLRVEALRPMATAIEIVQSRYGVTITYEEPVYKWRGDVMGTVGSGQAGLAGGILERAWDKDHDTADEVLAMLVNGRIEPRGEPANMFAVQRIADGHYHVYPLKARDSDGTVVPTASLLSKTVRVDVSHSTVAEALSRCMSLALGVDSVAVEARGDAVAKSLQQPASQMETTSAAAREMLSRIVRAADRRMSWQLLFDPASGKHRLVLYSRDVPRSNADLVKQSGEGPAVPNTRHPASATPATRAPVSSAGFGVTDELEIRLAEVEKLRAGLDTHFDEVDKRCKALLATYTKPEEQARIYYEWAHVEGQSGLQHPQRIIDCAQKALSLPLDPINRLQLQMYWGNALEVSHRGVQGNELKRARGEIVVVYLQATTECLKCMAGMEAKPLRETALMTRSNAEGLKKKELERFQRFLDAFENQIAFLYSRRPFATDEIRALAEKTLPDKTARKRLMAKVRARIGEREPERPIP